MENGFLNRKFLTNFIKIILNLKVMEATKVYTATPDGHIVKITRNGSKITSHLKNKGDYIPPQYFNSFHFKKVNIGGAVEFLKVVDSLITESNPKLKVTSISKFERVYN